MFEKLVNMIQGQMTPRWVACKLLEMMLRGVTASEIGGRLAAMPGIQQFLGDQNAEVFWNTLMSDPEAKAAVPPMYRRQFRQYIEDVVREVRLRITV